METDPKKPALLSITARRCCPVDDCCLNLAGLGLISLLSAGCLFWLQKLQSVFLAVALGSLF
jgi:hypothetical protein